MVGLNGSTFLNRLNCCYQFLFSLQKEDKSHKLCYFSDFYIISEFYSKIERDNHNYKTLF